MVISNKYLRFRSKRENEKVKGDIKEGPSFVLGQFADLLVLHSFDVVYCSWTLRHSLLLTLAGHKLTYPTIEFFLVWHRV